MAFPDIRSVSSNATDTDGTSIVCTHPAGLTAGDLMVLYVTIYNAGGGRFRETPSGWTELTAVNDANNYVITVYTKVADAADVSNGSTTVSFTGGSVDKSSYAMFAITDYAPSTPISLFESDTTNLSAQTLITETTALTPLTSESLVLSAFYVTDTDLSAVLTGSTYTLTPTTTMTEQVDEGIRDGSSDGFGLFIASGDYSGTNEITSRSVTVSESVSFNSYSIILLVNAVQNASADISHLSIPPTIESVTGSNTATANVSHLAIPPTIEPVLGESTSDQTQWINPDKPNTSWTNPDKP